jgi:hypothetical protein
MNQIRRTLNQLVEEGIAVMSRRLSKDFNDRLPYWENLYQIADMVEENFFKSELYTIERKISSAYNGFGTLFGGEPDGDGLTAQEKAEMTRRIKSIIQKVHPDKPNGNSEYFIRMKSSLDKLKKMKTKL